MIPREGKPPFLQLLIGRRQPHAPCVEAQPLVLRLADGKRTAIGARVTVVSGDRTQFHDVIPVNGYLAQGDPRLHFGLGPATKADRVEIRWPDGTAEELQAIAAGACYWVDLTLTGNPASDCGGGGGPTPPANDDCDDAVSVDPNTCVDGTTVLATIDDAECVTPTTSPG